MGVYALSELRAFVALDGTREDGEHVLSWLRAILNPIRHERRRADYSFSDLVSLFVVRELLRKGVKPRKIRRPGEHDPLFAQLARSHSRQTPSNKPPSPGASLI